LNNGKFYLWKADDVPKMPIFRVIQMVKFHPNMDNASFGELIMGRMTPDKVPFERLVASMNVFVCLM